MAKVKLALKDDPKLIAKLNYIVMLFAAGKADSVDLLIPDNAVSFNETTDEWNKADETFKRTGMDVEI